MELKLIGGPMDGGRYVLAKETGAVGNRSTNRKPDGLWFDGQDEHGRNVQHQYKDSGILEDLERGGVAMRYVYDGQVVDTGIEMETACEHGVKDGDWCEPCNRAMKAAQVDPDNETGKK